MERSLMHRRQASTPTLFALAAMLSAVPMVASAQSFNATGTIVSGVGAISTGVGKTTVSVDAPNLVIDWSPKDTAIGGGAIDFQIAGTLALFTGRLPTALTVLNRIMPADVTRPIVFGGRVVARFVDPVSGGISPGGTLFFYSPSGLLLAPDGPYNVGSLVRSASDLNFDAVAGSSSAGRDPRLLLANAESRAGARKGDRSAAAAIDADRSAVIVAADASTITFRPDGLYDIQIDQAPAPEADGTVRRVTMVVVPRNDAITLAIKGAGALGFGVAGAAKVDGDAVVLSGGPDRTVAMIEDIRLKASGAAIGPVQNAGETAAVPSHPCPDEAPAPADDNAFISVGGIASTLDVQGNRQIAVPGRAGTGADAPNSDRRTDDDHRACQP
jgi:hypothetical protein